jgi:DNA-binding winged helix-turn-helix (wHTH) protein/TolB-like protein
MAAPVDGGRIRFGVFDFDTGSLELWKDGRPVRVTPQSLRLLAVLLARPGELVSRDDIQVAIWGRETFVDFEQGVNHGIRELRAALGDSAESPRYIQTLPRRGYRFIAAVGGSGAANASAASVPVVPPAESVDPGHDAEPARAHMPPVQEAGRPRRSRVLWVATLGLAVLAAVASVPYARRTGAGPLPHATAVSVRPFSTLQSDPSLGIGLANAISARLGGQQIVTIRPTGTAPAASSGSPSDTPDARGTTLVLDGEVGRDGGDITVLARLRDDASGAVRWSEQFSVRADEFFSVEDVIAERVVGALKLGLAAAEQDRLRRRYTNNAAAYEQYLRGRATLVLYTQEGTLRAIEAFEGALRNDPRYALARAGLAMACADMYLRFARPDEVERWGERTEREARAALELDPDLAEAHLARAAVARKREFDWNATMGASRRALVLNPNLDQAHFFIAAAYYHLGYMEEALIAMRKGRDLRGPDVVEPARIEALVALFSGNFTPARVHLEEVSRQSSQAIGDTYLALAYYYTGSVDRGRTMLESLASHPSASTATRAGAALAGVLAALDEPAAARQHVAGVLAREYRDHHVAYSLGAAYAQLGDEDHAVRWLRTAADTGFPCVTWFARDPLLEPIRQSPQFAEVMTHVRARRESTLSSASP